MSRIGAIQPKTESFAGGVVRWIFVLYDEVAHIPDPYQGIITEPVEFKALETNWRLGYGTIDTMRYTEPVERTAQGLIYEQEFTCIYPGSDEEAQYQLELMAEHRYLLLIELRNGEQVLAGIGGGLKMQWEHRTGGAYADRTDYQLRFTGRSLRRAPRYAASVVIDDTVYNVPLRPLELQITPDKTTVFRYEPVRFTVNIADADLYYYRFEKDGNTLGAGEAGIPDGVSPGITDPQLRSGQAVERYFAALGPHDVVAFASNLTENQSGGVRRNNIVQVLDKSFTGIGSRQPDAWFDASIYTPGTTTNNLGFLTGQSAGADNAQVIDFNGYAHVAFSNFGGVSPSVNINGDFAFAVKIVFPTTVFNYGNRYARISPMSHSNRQDLAINKVVDITYTYNTGGNVDQDYVLYAYRVGGIINAYINDEQVINNVYSVVQSALGLGANENYACAELILYNQTLTQAESDGLRNYMLQKYSIGPYA